NKGRVYSLKAYEIPEAGRQAKGTAIVNLLNINPEEKITAVIPVDEFSEDLNMVMLTKKGTIKKTELEQFNSIRKSGMIAITLKEEDALINVKLTKENDEIIIVTKNGIAIRFSQKDVRVMGRNAAGVRAIELKEDDEVVSMDIAEDSKYLLVITEKGYGKRTELNEYKTQKRGGKGI
ncbi:DNA gyrase C-terminal beta-propeller domain-containing protein, partial [Vibrio parahaemolyticus]|nr:DNA gyrase C-terminal beta-propeller domain-containing protein [Vibrio parahaemolyticus]